MYLFAPVMPSFAAGPEMNRTLFCSAIGASARPTVDEVAPPMIL